MITSYRGSQCLLLCSVDIDLESSTEKAIGDLVIVSLAVLGEVNRTYYSIVTQDLRCQIILIVLHVVAVCFSGYFRREAVASRERKAYSQLA